MLQRTALFGSAALALSQLVACAPPRANDLLNPQPDPNLIEPDLELASLASDPDATDYLQRYMVVRELGSTLLEAAQYTMLEQTFDREHFAGDDLRTLESALTCTRIADDVELPDGVTLNTTPVRQRSVFPYNSYTTTEVVSGITLQFDTPANCIDLSGPLKVEVRSLSSRSIYSLDPTCGVVISAGPSEIPVAGYSLRNGQVQTANSFSNISQNSVATVLSAAAEIVEPLHEERVRRGVADLKSGRVSVTGGMVNREVASQWAAELNSPIEIRLGHRGFADEATIMKALELRLFLDTYPTGDGAPLNITLGNWSIKEVASPPSSKERMELVQVNAHQVVFRRLGPDSTRTFEMTTSEDQDPIVLRYSSNGMTFGIGGQVLSRVYPDDGIGPPTPSHGHESSGNTAFMSDFLKALPDIP